MSDELLAESKEDLERFNKLSPKRFWRNKLVHFRCSICNETSKKTLKTLKFPFVCRSCTCKISQNNPDTKLKRKNTCIEKYGVEAVQQCKSINEKSKESVKNRTKELSEQYRIQRLRKEEKKTLQRYKSYYEDVIDYHDGIVYCHCKVCNNYYEIERFLLTNRKRCGLPLCTICHPLYSFPYSTNVSKGEEEIHDFIRTFYKGEIHRNVRNIISPYELDLYIPELKIAIEYDGTYWHMDSRFYESSDYNERMKRTAQEIWDRDLEKIRLCEEKDIELIRIAEYDWKNNPETQRALNERISGESNIYYHKIEKTDSGV